ncbi:MAG TPA: hypothetical protein VF806_10370 [Anaerolineaceae bacterium]
MRSASKVDGIEVYVPAESLPKPEEMVNFQCPQCGASTQYSVTARKITCEYCGYSQEVNSETLGRSAEGFEFRVDSLMRSDKGWGEDRKELSCQHCGGVVSVSPATLSYTCPFCGSNEVLFRDPQEDVLRPRYLIPFKVDPQACQVISQKWLGGSWMVPRELRHIPVEKFNPLYIPYWTFSTSCFATWKAEVAHEKVEHYYENGQMRERRTIEWRQEAGKVQKEFSDLLVPGTHRMNMTALGRIDKFDVADLVLYEPSFLAGMQALSYDVPLEQAWDLGRHLIRDRIRRACLDRASSTQVRNLNITLNFQNEQWRYILAPLYTSIYRFDDKTFQVLINGQSGKIAGPRPVDWEKVWWVIAALLLPGFLTSLVGLLFVAGDAGSKVTGVGLFLFFVGIVFDFFIYQGARGLEHD